MFSRAAARVARLPAGTRDATPRGLYCATRFERAMFARTTFAFTTFA
jgi:hypothetical protein